MAKTTKTAKPAVKKPVKRTRVALRVSREEVIYSQDEPIPVNAISTRLVGQKRIYDLSGMKLKECMIAPLRSKSGVLTTLGKFLKTPEGKNRDFVYAIEKNVIKVWRTK